MRAKKFKGATVCAPHSKNPRNPTSGCGDKPDILKDPENNLFYKQVKKSSSCHILPFIWTLWKKF